MATYSISTYSDNTMWVDGSTTDGGSRNVVWQHNPSVSDGTDWVVPPDSMSWFVVNPSHLPPLFIPNAVPPKEEKEKQPEPPKKPRRRLGEVGKRKFNA